MSTAADSTGAPARPRLAEGQAFFLAGAGRSGTTPLIRALGTGTNVETVSEPRPRFTEAVAAGAEPEPRLLDVRWPQIRTVVGRGLMYGEKDLQVFDWLPAYRSLFNGRFVFVKRDGRDVVRSFLDYHTRVNGNFYREAQDDTPLAPEALARREALPDAAMLTERCRPRPRPGDPWYARWGTLSRLQMAAWYWAHVSLTARRHLATMPTDAWREIDTTEGIRVEQVRELFEFLELDGFDADAVAAVLDSGVNTIEAVAGRAIERTPPWREWSDAMREQFDEVAGAALTELGYPR